MDIYLVFRYSLQAFVSHMGSSPQSGHYVCHIKEGDDWVIFNDNKVARSERPPKELGYLYLYKRCDAWSIRILLPLSPFDGVNVIYVYCNFLCNKLLRLIKHTKLWCNYLFWPEIYNLNAVHSIFTKESNSIMFIRLVYILILV